MFTFKIDLAPFEEQVKRMDAAIDQMPFALSRALNDAANDAYEYLIEETWPKAVKVRNASFLRWAMRTKFSTKYDLEVEIFDNTPDQRAHLALHAEGGVKLPKGAHLIVPTDNVSRGASGVRQSQKPANMVGKVVKGNKIYQAIGRGKTKHLKLMYVLVPRTQQPKDVPFHEDFEQIMIESSRRHFKERMIQAMRSRK
ncbi:hypothetical protein AS156_30550 [Bradyrhizobium macuxiense]|uniref:Uncharacterized protein n=1 Tax=Bradyrhizobium macuxiense TaxID=1755647 RepID=A0A109K322_9BRAD|nr:hypothetical protein [Bradyrhizobium macuxiense]KWV59723.1 hypothetical protein AS156_30550 [Bradyrhizobium macuxiense]